MEFYKEIYIKNNKKKKKAIGWPTVLYILHLIIFFKLLFNYIYLILINLSYFAIERNFSFSHSRMPSCILCVFL